MFDPNRTLALVKGALLDAEATWRSYLPEAGDWKRTAFLLTGPLIVLSTVLAYLGGLTSSGSSLLGMFRPTIASSLFNMVLAVIGIGIAAFIYSALAGVFGGKKDFALGLAALTLAFVPGYVGQAFSWLPWIGGLLAFGLGIYSLVLLWRILPLYLEVPAAKHAAHYIVSLIGTIIVMAVIGSLVAGMRPGADISRSFDTGSYSDSGNPLSESGSLLGAAMRQGELMAAAQEDQYTPPADGELAEKQVKDFIRTMSRVAEVRQAKAAQLQELKARAENDEEMSIGDLTSMMGSATGLAGIGGVEIEIVKTSGGNWAEHTWVRDSLRTAWLQKDINDTVKHNYELYLEYESELAPYIQ